MIYVLELYAVARLVTFCAHGFDKRAARLGHRRSSEARLHAFELFCAWPGGLAGQALFRHNRRKTSDMAAFWGHRRPASCSVGRRARLELGPVELAIGGG